MRFGALTQILDDPAGDRTQRQIRMLSEGMDSLIVLDVLDDLFDGGSDTRSTVTLFEGGDLEVSPGGSVFRNTYLDLDVYATVTGTLDVGVGSELVGSGTIVGELVNHGTVNPDTARGLAVTGDFTNSAGGVLVAEIGGRTAGTFDQLRVSGTARLGGELALRKVGSFVPNLGEQFVILPVRCPRWRVRAGQRPSLRQRDQAGAGLRCGRLPRAGDG